MRLSARIEHRKAEVKAAHVLKDTFEKRASVIEALEQDQEEARSRYDQIMAKQQSNLSEIWRGY
jgi:hypothetical protein